MADMSKKTNKQDTFPRPPPPAPGAAAAAPVCRCQEPAVERTVVREGGNKGKKFWSCSKPREDSCGFFEWADQSGGGAVAGPSRKRPLATSTNVCSSYILLSLTIHPLICGTAAQGRSASDDDGCRRLGYSAVSVSTRGSSEDCIERGESGQLSFFPRVYSNMRTTRP
jgi:hypothetical protein